VERLAAHNERVNAGRETPPSLGEVRCVEIQASCEPPRAAQVGLSEAALRQRLDMAGSSRSQPKTRRRKPVVQELAAPRLGRAGRPTGSVRDAVLVGGSFVAVRCVRQVQGDVIESARTRPRPTAVAGSTNELARFLTVALMRSRCCLRSSRWLGYVVRMHYSGEHEDRRHSPSPGRAGVAR
jgi:hypothetical protein